MRSINKILSVIYFSVLIVAIYIVYLRFVRYWLADNEVIAIAMLNPNQIPTNQPLLFSIIMVLIILVAIFLLRLKTGAQLLPRLLKGLYGYSLLFLTAQLITVEAKQVMPQSWLKSVYESKHLFVEVQTSQTRLRESPSLQGKVITTVDAGTLLLLNDVRTVDGITWNRVLIEPQQYAWIARVITTHKDTRKRLSNTSKFYFTRADQYSFLLAFLGLFWGILTYQHRR